MHNWFDKHVFFDAVALGQIITAVFAALISIISLNKDFRAKTMALQREAKVIRYIIITLTLLSVSNIFVSTYNSHIDKKALNDSLTILRKSSDSLRATLDRNSIRQSNLIIESQRQSASDLKIAANNLHDLINGSDSVPILRFVAISGKDIGATLFNMSSKPVYLFNVKVTNYDNLLNCPRVNSNVITFDADCFNANTQEIPQISSLNSQTDIQVTLPTPISIDKSQKGRYFLIIILKNKTFYEECIYKIVNNQISQSVKVFETSNDKILRSWTVFDKIHKLKITNWAEEFPLPLVMHLFKKVN